MTENSSRPFEGIRIVEFGQFVAVPFAAQLLGEGGAHVIKIEALEGDPTRRLSPIAPAESRTFISRNRNKHSLPLALSAAQPLAALANRLRVPERQTAQVRPTHAQMRDDEHVVEIRLLHGRNSSGT